jgi:hypothetical protein
MAAIIRSLKKTTDMFEKEINNLEISVETQNKLIKRSVRELTYEFLENVKNSGNVPENDV